MVVVAGLVPGDEVVLVPGVARAHGDLELVGADVGPLLGVEAAVFGLGAVEADGEDRAALARLLEDLEVEVSGPLPVGDRRFPVLGLDGRRLDAVVEGLPGDVAVLHLHVGLVEGHQLGVGGRDGTGQRRQSQQASNNSQRPGQRSSRNSKLGDIAHRIRISRANDAEGAQEDRTGELIRKRQAGVAW